MQGFREGICQTAIFMVCAKAIAHFRPNASYENYLRLFLSAIILAQILTPICRLFGRDVTGEFEEQTGMFLQNWQSELSEIEQIEGMADDANRTNGDGIEIPKIQISLD